MYTSHLGSGSELRPVTSLSTSAEVTPLPALHFQLPPTMGTRVAMARAAVVTTGLRDERTEVSRLGLCVACGLGCTRLEVDACAVGGRGSGRSRGGASWAGQDMMARTV